MNGQKQSRVDLVEKKIKALTSVMQKMMEEIENVRDLGVVTLETAKLMPDFQVALDKLKEKLERIGLTVADVALEGDNGKVTAEVKQFGGRFGKDTDGSDINDDGISHKKEGGLKLEISYETLKKGTTKVYAKLV